MASDSGDRNPTLKKCLAVLREARNDSEQFAALLLVRNGCGMEPPAPSPQERAGEGEGETRFWEGERPEWRFVAGLAGVGSFGARCCDASVFPSANGGSLALARVC